MLHSELFYIWEKHYVSNENTNTHTHTHDICSHISHLLD